MPFFKVSCRYESSRSKSADFHVTFEAPDENAARETTPEMAQNIVQTAERFVITKISQLKLPSKLKP